MKYMRRILILMLAGTLLAGCADKTIQGSTFAPTETSIFVSRDGKFSSALVETYEVGEYDQGELQSAAEKEVVAYNMARGAAGEAQNATDTERLPAAVASCMVKDGMVRVMFEYASPEDYVQFAKESFVVTSEETGEHENLIEELQFSLDKGGASGVSFQKAADGSVVDAATIDKLTEAKFLMVNGVARIQAEGKILYMTEGCTLVDEYTVTTPEGKSFFVFQ